LQRLTQDGNMLAVDADTQLDSLLVIKSLSEFHNATTFNRNAN
jgi:hypothetical protein